MIEEEIQKKPKGKIERIEEKLDTILDSEKKKKNKPFRLPYKARVGKMKLKQNYVTVIRLGGNANLDFDKEQIVDQTIMVRDIPRIASGEYLWSYKNKPAIVIFEDSVKPISPAELAKKSLEDGSNTAGYRLLMNRMQVEAIKLGKKIGGLGIGIGALILGGIIAYSLLTGG